MSGWDIALVVVVSLMGTAVAYLRNPEHKAFVLMLPLPFSLATMAVARPLDASNMLAMGVMLGYTVLVWFLHARLCWPILPAIALSAIGYCLAGAALAKLPLAGNAIFWPASSVMFLLSVALIRFLPHHAEPHHRTPLPVWIKLPAIALVIIALVAIKRQLGGFMTMFPMVGVVASYEARRSLWAIVRRMPWITALMTPVMVVMYLLQNHLGIGWAIIAGWPLHLMLLWLFRNHYQANANSG